MMALPDYYSELSPFQKHFKEGHPILCYHKIAPPPAKARIDQIAWIEPRRARGLDHANRAAAHNLTDLDRRQILVLITHPDAVGGVQGQIDIADKDLAIL
jgi:hypothetical protein